LSDLPTDARDLVLVTGASGFIGNHLSARLCADGLPVRILQRESNREIRRGVQVFHGDVRDAAAVQSAMQDVKIVFHLGGIASVDLARSAPDHAFQVNTVGTQNILEAARQANVQRVVLLSTAHVYGVPSRLPITEDTLPAPASIYAATKFAADVLAFSYHRSFALPVTLLRPVNVYGPGQRTGAVIPTIISQAVAGSPIQVRSLIPRRDYIFVTDVVEALLSAATSADAVGETFILASGRPVSVAQLVQKVAHLTGIPGTYDPAQPEDSADCIFGDATRAGKILGWRPVVELQEGLQRTIEWWRATMATTAVRGRT
jgi:nucleoside-diphosphate-sugar epimerase